MFEEALKKSEPSEVRNLAKSLRERLQMSRDQHAYASEFFRHRYFLLAVPSVVLAALIGVVEVVVPGDGPWRKATVAVMSAVNTCILTITHMYGFQTQQEQHFQAAKTYATLVTEFDFAVWYPGYSDPAVMQKALASYLVVAEKKTKDLSANMPPVPTFIIQQVHRRSVDLGDTLGGGEVTDPGLARLRRIVDFLPALGSASVASKDFFGSGDTQHQIQGVAMAIFACQCVIWNTMRLSRIQSAHHPCFSAYTMLLGPAGVVAMGLLTWSLVLLVRKGDLWQLTYAVPSVISTCFAMAQARPKENLDSDTYAVIPEGMRRQTA